MADFVLFFSGKLSECLVVTIRQEHRIITETVSSARLEGDSSPHLSLEYLKDLSVERDGDRADEAGTAVFAAIEFLEQFCYALGIARGITGRVDAGTSIESFDFQSGVIRESGGVTVTAGGSSFQRGIFGKGGSVLFDLRKTGIIRLTPSRRPR